jgi:hypothetical protein
MKTTDELKARVHELENELRLRDERIKELREEQTQHHELMTEMREWIEDKDALIESWIDVFEMQLGDSGAWQFDSSQSEIWTEHLVLIDKHNALLRDWNKFVGRYNSTVKPGTLGRPLAASPAQCTKVRQLREAGASLRAIAVETSLSMRTVRTILDKDMGKDQGSKRTKELRRKELDRQRAKAFRARNARREAIPQTVNELRKRATTLIKAAKGLGQIHR